MAGDSLEDLRAENERLRAENEEISFRLEEAEQALEAIRTGQVDSLVVEGPNGPRIFSLEGAIYSYRVLVEAMNEGAATLGDDGAILYCNSRFARMLDMPIERVMGSVIHERVPACLRDEFAALLRSTDDGESRAELVMLGRDDHEIPVYLSVSAIHDDGQRVHCLVVTDLRAQKRNEQIVAAERLARSVLEQAADAIVVCNENGRIIRASGSAAELCGRNPLLEPFEEVFPVLLTTPEVPEVPDGVLARVMRGEVFHAVPAWLVRSDGRRADLLLSATSLRGSGDRTIGFVLTMVDVTRHRRAENALRQSEAMLREADRRKNEFLAVLSHELRNPLAPIKNGLYLLGRVPPGSDKAKRAQIVIERQVNHMIRLIDDLLDITRITQGKTRLRKERVGLNDLLRHTAEDHRSLFAKSNVRLAVEIDGPPLYVEGDPIRLAQIIGNLLSNAAKFTLSGGRTTLSLARMDEGMAAIRVRDTGTGIAPEVLPHLFEPFVQADKTLDRSPGGLGLGLALVKGLVELHGGDVSVHSEGDGQGTEITVRLPLDIQAAPDLMVSPLPKDSTSSRRVLVIEDNVDAAQSLKDALELSGHVVDVAHSGPEGLEKARRFRPDVILCDIGLPNMNGFQVAERVRADAALRSISMVALSGYASPEDMKKSAKAGFTWHLAKPPDWDALEKTLAQTPARARPDEHQE